MQTLFFSRVAMAQVHWFRRMLSVGLLPDTQNCGLCIRRECRERFLRHLFQRKWLVNDPGMNHGPCATHVPWCMSGSLARGGGEDVPGMVGACATRNFAYLVRGPCFKRVVTIDALTCVWQQSGPDIYYVSVYTFKKMVKVARYETQDNELSDI